MQTIRAISMNTTPHSLQTPSLTQLVHTCNQHVVQGQISLAITAYTTWLEQHPKDTSSAAAAFNLALLYREQNNFTLAIAYNQLATQLNPRLHQAWVNLGLCYETQGQSLQALKIWEKALPTAQGQTLLLNHIGRVQEISKDYAKAQKSLLQSLIINAEQPDVWQHYLHLRAKQCQWPVIHTIAGLAGFEEPQAMLERLSPFSILAQTDDPQLQQKCARQFLARKLKPVQPFAARARPRPTKRLRIGYLSGDFKAHAVSILMAEVFELHNRTDVEVWGFDYSDPAPSPMRQRVLAAFDHHIPLHQLTDQQAAAAIYAEEIDILIDLTGLTAGARLGILSYRAAPIQIGYLGFMGSSAMPGLDYVLADRYLVPEPLRAQFSEKILYLECYQANDRQRKIGRPPTRQSCELPQDAVVLCAFNNNYKITPKVWAVWMQILHRAPAAILWILADNPQAQQQLTRQAQAQGIDIQRLYFAQRVEPQAYLARLQCADLFLDTTPYGAGTTASDALWAGLPVLTCPGRSMVSRMAGSLLMAMDLPELIAENWQDYEDKAVHWVRHPGQLQRIRQAVQNKRATCRLFDTPAFVQNLEQVLRNTYTLWNEAA